MSANTTIREGGKDYPFGPVKCLMVEGDNGEFYPWYPEADRQLDSLSVNRNDIYRASDRGVYGWNRVSVNVPQVDRVTGRDPETGQEVTVTVNPETGELVETVVSVVPVEIRVIAPPTNPYGVYVDGQTITKDGMVVKAYDANGDETQIVPVGEITLNPDRAVYDESTDQHGQGESTLDGITIPFALADGLTKWATTEHSRYYEYHPTGDTVAMIKDDSWRMFSVQSSVPYTLYKVTSPPVQQDGVFQLNSISGSNYFSRSQGDAAVTRDPVPDASSAAAGLSYAQIAKIIFEGTRTIKPAGSPQTITVSWPRSGDGAILETTFDILVGPRSGQGDD